MRVALGGGSGLSAALRRQVLPSRFHGPRTHQRKHNSSSPTPPETSKTDGSPRPGSGADSAATPPSEAPAPSSNIPPLNQQVGAAAPDLGPVTKTLQQKTGSGALRKIGAAFQREQARRPYVTQVWISLLIYLFGDLSAQLMFPTEREVRIKAGTEDDEDEVVITDAYDPQRTLRHLTVGLVSSIPSYKWFMFLHHNFNYASKYFSVFVKVCVQQAVFTPVFNTYFFSMHSLLGGATLDETWERLKKALPQSITNSVKLWPAITAFSFMYVDPQFRSVFGGVIAVGWQTYLSWLNQTAAKAVQAEEIQQLNTAHEQEKMVA